MPTSALARTTSERASSHGLADEILRSLVGESLAVMLYGSQARGTAERGSDIDVLQLVASGPGAYHCGRVAITAYTPAALHTMAQQGSLFVRHLRAEGVVLMDTSGVLARGLAAYREPESYGPLLAEIKNAARGFLIGEDEFWSHCAGLGRLGIYLLRTSLYVGAVSAGIQTFDVESVARSLGAEHLIRTLKLRRRGELSTQDCDQIRCAVIEHFGATGQTRSLTQAIVDLAADSPHASALLLQVGSTPQELDYVGLPLPPL